jgi:hypothetical protein
MLCMPVQAAQREKVFRFGKEYFPAELPDTYKWQPNSSEAGFKGLQVLCFTKNTWSQKEEKDSDGHTDEGDTDGLADAFPRWSVLDVRSCQMHPCSAGHDPTNQECMLGCFMHQVLCFNRSTRSRKEEKDSDGDTDEGDTEELADAFPRWSDVDGSSCLTHCPLQGMISNTENI